MRSSRLGISCTRPCFCSRFERGRDLAIGQHFDSGFERRVFLPDDLVELCGSHSSLLQLLKWAARFNALMLAHIADQQHAVIGTEAGEKLAHLVGAGKARFIDEVEMSSARRRAGSAVRARNPCRVPASTPASPSWRAAREVGAKPST